MRTHIRRASLSVTIAGCLLAGCAGPRVGTMARAPAVAAVPPRPVLPAGLPAANAVPRLGPDGAYLTINHGVSAAAAVWHVRAALNVAALACRGSQEAALIAGYNAVLARQRAPLAAAYAAVRAEDRAASGEGWEQAHDRDMTRIYNFFAQPFAKDGFCAVAGSVMARAAAVDPAAFAGFASAALAELEAPFTDGYRGTDAYRQQLAAWDAAYGGTDGPRLAYAPVETLLAWAPPVRGEQMASARR